MLTKLPNTPQGHPFSYRAMVCILQSVYQRSLEWRFDISVPEVGIMRSGEQPRIREKSQEACLPIDTGLGASESFRGEDFSLP